MIFLLAWKSLLILGIGHFHFPQRAIYKSGIHFPLHKITSKEIKKTIFYFFYNYYSLIWFAGLAK